MSMTCCTVASPKALFGQFRHVPCYRRGGIDLAFVRQHRRQRAHERFRDRKGEMLLFGRKLAEITLVDDAAAMHDHDAVRPGLCECLAPRARLAIHVGVGHRIEAPLGAREHEDLAMGLSTTVAVGRNSRMWLNVQRVYGNFRCEASSHRASLPAPVGTLHDSGHFRIAGCRIGKAREVHRAPRRAGPERKRAGDGHEDS